MLTKKTLFSLLFAAFLISFTCSVTDAQRRPSIRQAAEKQPAGPCFIEPKEDISPRKQRDVNFIPVSDTIVLVSVLPDWDCDGVADEKDNCVGMANRSQADKNRNGVGDVCEAATYVRASVTPKPERSPSEVNNKKKEKKRIVKRSRPVNKSASTKYVKQIGRKSGPARKSRSRR